MGKKKKRRKSRQNNLLVLQLLVIVVVVLVIFEGKLIYTMFTHRAGASVATSAADNSASDSSTAGGNITVTELSEEGDDASPTSDEVPTSENSSGTQIPSGDSVSPGALAGLALNLTSADSSVSDASYQETETEAERISEEIDSPAVVGLCDTAVDDSFFANSVFIGDSRMMGFRNSSGITQGAFLTSVGLSTDAMSEANISSSEGMISVYQGLSGEQYDKIYLMLGTNDLGYYPWDDFEPNFTNVIQQFHKLQPDATIYVCSVIYVDESKITTSYDNNENVRKVNGYLLNVCEKLDYCYYLNLNEIFTNGYGSLLEEASSDGIHLYDSYCKQMLDYLKTHYVSE